LRLFDGSTDKFHVTGGKDSVPRGARDGQVSGFLFCIILFSILQGMSLLDFFFWQVAGWQRLGKRALIEPE
jgi:hypothetical protein